MNYQENTHAENLKANARAKKAIAEGKTEIETGITETIHGLVNQVALYRGINRTSAKKILNQLLKEVTK